jgi:hypothetical protein
MPSKSTPKRKNVPLQIQLQKPLKQPPNQRLQGNQWIKLSNSGGLALISYYLINQSIYAGYIGIDMSEGERTGLLAKSLILLVIFVVSENILKFRSISSEIDYLRKLRAFFLFFPVALALIGSYEEIGSRILYYYFWVELILLLLLAERGFNKTIAFVLVSYAFAFNVWNNLGGL